MGISAIGKSEPDFDTLCSFVDGLDCISLFFLVSGEPVLKLLLSFETTGLHPMPWWASEQEWQMVMWISMTLRMSGKICLKPKPLTRTSLKFKGGLGCRHKKGWIKTCQKLEEIAMESRNSLVIKIHLHPFTDHDMSSYMCYIRYLLLPRAMTLENSSRTRCNRCCAAAMKHRRCWPANCSTVCWKVKSCNWFALGRDLRPKLHPKHGAQCAPWLVTMKNA